MINLVNCFVDWMLGEKKYIEGTNKEELIKELNTNFNYAIMRGLNSDDIKKDIDILISEEDLEESKDLKYFRILHLQTEEKHKGLIFVKQSALKRKVWNGEYWELCFRDRIRMKILRKVKKIYGWIVK